MTQNKTSEQTTKLPHNVNFNYIFSHCDQSKFEIPYFYDKQEWKIGETYRIRISNVYDPSKFWIVLKDRELEIFQNFVINFYKKYGLYYKMSTDTISKNMYCVIFTENCYFRGLIINIPHSLTLEQKALVFLIDFGYSAMIKFADIYYLSEKLYSIPRFAVRASMYSLQPYSDLTWSDNVVQRFTELVSKKVLLAVLECTDPRRRIIEIKIGIVKELSEVVDISYVLMSEKLARTVTSRKQSPKKKKFSRYSPKTKYPYLFPSFEAIEGGRVPPSVHITDMLRHCVARDILFKPYITYTGSEK